MAAFELSVSTSVREYHIYKDEWLPETTDTNVKQDIRLGGEIAGSHEA